MQALNQIAALLANSLRTLPKRWPTALVTVVGTATAVGVLVALLAIVAGAQQMSRSGADPARVIVLPAGAASESSGALSKADAALIAQSPAIRRDSAGVPLFQPIALVLVDLRKRGTEAHSSVQLRGTGPAEWRMDPHLKIIAGRTYRPGINEVVVGKSALAQFEGLEIGRRLSLRGTTWTVVGVFSDAGGVNESGMLADADTVMSAFRRDAYQSAQAQLISTAAIQTFATTLARDPRLGATVRPYGEYVAEQIRPFISVVKFVSYMIGVVIAIGVILGTINTMYATIDSRAREVATLRAIGFGGGVIVLSVLLEVLVLSIPSGCLGVVVARLLFAGEPASAGRFCFEIAVPPRLMLFGLLWALFIALLAGLPPSLRAARVPVVVSLRGR
jgi:putative ABC transport system permease protein